MSINIKNELTPKREDGGLDHRYGKSIRNVIDIAGIHTIKRLEEFHEKSFELEKKYGGDAFHLCLSLFQANLDNWELKAIKKSLRNLLLELGFKPYNATRLIGASQFEFESKPPEYYLPVEKWNTDFCSKEVIENSIKNFNYIQNLPVRSKYELSLCSNDIYFDNGFDKPIFHQITNSYSKILTTRELENLRKQYPKLKPEYWKGGNGSRNTKVLSSANNSNTQHKLQQPKEFCFVPKQGEVFEMANNDDHLMIHQDSTNIEHVEIKPSQEELIKKLNIILNQIDMEKVSVDEALRSKLEPFQYQLERLSDLAKSIKSRPKYL